MPTFEITSPEGVKYRVNAPEGATQADAIAYVQANHTAPKQTAAAPAPKQSGFPSASQTLGNLLAGTARTIGGVGAKMISPFESPAANAARVAQLDKDMQSLGAQPDSSVYQAMAGVAPEIGNMIAGGVRGMGSGGATLIRPFESAKANEARRTAMDEQLQAFGARPDSFGYKAGKLGGELALTAGMGGAIAKGLGAVPYIAKAAPSLIEGIASGGFKAGTLPGRVVGGAITGGAMAGAVDPNQAGIGAALGGGLPLVGAAGKLIGKGTKTALGFQTGVGSEAIQQAYSAGKMGGDASRAFLGNMRGEVPLTDVLDAAKNGLTNIKQANQAAYRAGMVGVKSDKTVLRFREIDEAVKHAVGKVTFRGQVTNEPGATAVGKALEAVNEWKRLPRAYYHTPEGLDALKQTIGGILDALPLEQKQARSAIGDIYSATRNSISQQAPTYAKTMKSYSEGADLVKQIEKSLTGGQNTGDETALRKLQALMRNNVQTGYGYKGQLADQLQSQGGVDIMPALAGQALSEWTPRGIQRLTAAPSSLLAYGIGGILPAATSLATSSPRLMGETAHLTGLLGRYLSPATDAARKVGYRTLPLLGTQ